MNDGSSVGVPDGVDDTGDTVVGLLPFPSTVVGTIVGKSRSPSPSTN